MQRYYSLDFVKFIGAIAVVIIHVTAAIANHDFDNFWNFHWYRPILNFAVPFFFASSGFILYHKINGSENGVPYLWNYAFRILKYYVFFTLFYIGFGIIIRFCDSIVLGTSFKTSIKKMVEGWSFIRIFNGDIGQYHLWFLTALFGACLILSVFIKLGLTAPQVLTISSILFILARIGYITIDEYYRYGGLILGLFYLSIGYYVASIDVRRVVYPGVCFLVSFFLYYVFMQKDVSVSEVLLGFTTFNLITLCAKYPEFGKGKLIAKWGVHSLEIYVLHLFARDIIVKLFVYNGMHRYYEYPVYFPVAIIFSVFFPILAYKAIRPIFEKVKLIR